MDLKNQIITLYKKTATQLPKDITLALKTAKQTEELPLATDTLQNILTNINLAKENSKPICQDTGTPFFYITHPTTNTQQELKKIILEATTEATEQIPLRPNAVNTLTDKNIGNTPIIHFEEGEELKIDLMLKGGGSENVSAIYQLPNQKLNAHRNLNGIRKCAIDAIFNAQGKGCPPYILGIAAGGNIEEVAHLSKKQLLRNLNDTNPIEQLKDLEETLSDQINQLNIGPLGLGGKTTTLGVKITTAPRHPASFFVGISIGSWHNTRHE